MPKILDEYRNGTRDPINFFCALGVFLLTLITYLRTVQPTVPYWDCGEFIACAATLSIPHPPGTPLFVMLGRIFAMLPIGGEVAWRVNLLSAIFSALAVLTAYHVITWIIRKWYRILDTIYKRVTVYAGGIIGSLLVAFSNTYWSNAVEAEVYGASMLILLLSIYFILKWTEYRKEEKGEKYLALFAFLSVLALGIHLTSFIVVPFAFLYILSLDRDYRKSIPLIITFAILNLIPFSITVYLVLSSLWLALCTLIHFWERIKEGWIYTIFISLAALIVFVAMGFSWVPLLVYGLAGWSLLTLMIYRLQMTQKFWRISFLITLLGLIGFSVQLYSPIRARHDPIINMSNPQTWDKVNDFIERRQYGQESMFKRMLRRRAEWKNQLGAFPRIGLWGFFRDQFSSPNLFVIFFPLGLIGFLFTMRQRWRLGTFMFLTCLAGTIGLVLYMNFADGTHQNPLIDEGRLEVRDRDYFFTPGFMLFGMFIGIGAASLMHFLFSYLDKLNLRAAFKKSVLLMILLAAFLPAIAYSHNYFRNDRSRNYLAFNYAKNLLESCRPNAVLFTNGDNDTFPVWCLQYAYGIRRDVRTAVLSLMVADWYIEELRDKFKLPITFTNEEIEALRPYLVRDSSLNPANNKIVRDSSVYMVSNQITDHVINNALVKSGQPQLWKELPMKYRNFARLDQSQFAADTTLYFDPPIQFATTVDPFGLRFNEKAMAKSPVDNIIEGLVYDVRPFKSKSKINVDFTTNYFLHTFNPEGVKNPEIYKDENARRLAENYWRIVAKTADEVYLEGSPEKAIALNVKAISISVSPAEAFKFLAKNLKYTGKLNQIYDYMSQVKDAPEEDLMLQSAKMLDAVFALDLNRYRGEISQSTKDQVSINSLAAERLGHDKQYLFYLHFLDDFMIKYAQSQNIRPFVDKAKSAVLQYLPSDERSALNLRFLSSASDSIKPVSGS